MRLKKIAVMTGTRAEYGLMTWLIRDLQSSQDFELQLIVAGTHLSEAFGRTVVHIENDGIPIAAMVECVSDDDSLAGMVSDYARAAAGFGIALGELRPDILIILGDRSEALAAAAAATMLRIPIGHIHGGEITEGAMDDAFRHAITKMAHLHFAAAQAYADRIIQMGEAPEKVNMVGTIGLDSFNRLELLSRQQLAKSLDIVPEKPFALVTFHPATLELCDAAEQANVLAEALSKFPNLQFIISKANSDPGGRAVNAVWGKFAQSHPKSVKLFSSLCQLKYLSAMKHSAIIIGNSSSGIIEAPALGKHTVNIGSRQRGRLMAKSIISVSVNVSEIVNAIRNCLASNPVLDVPLPPYGLPGDTSGEILSILRRGFDSDLNTKVFHDLYG